MVNLADIAGSNAAAPLSSSNVTARTVNFVVTGAGTVRVGDSTITSARGLPVTATLPLTLAYAGRDFSYSLAQLNAYVPTGSTLSIAYEPFN